MFFYEGVGRFHNCTKNTSSRWKCYSKAMISASSSQPGGAILYHFNVEKPDSTMTSENKLVRKAYCRWQSNCNLPSWTSEYSLCVRRLLFRARLTCIYQNNTRCGRKQQNVSDKNLVRAQLELEQRDMFLVTRVFSSFHIEFFLFETE